MLNKIISIVFIVLFCFRTTHAEVMDKMSSNEANIVFFTFCSFLILVLTRYKPLFLIFVIPITTMYFLALFGEINDKFVGPAILAEAGQGYIDNAYRLFILTIASLFIGIIWRIYYKKHNKIAEADAQKSRAA